MRTIATNTREVVELTEAIGSFNQATELLQNEYRGLQQQVERLAWQLKQKNRELQESLAERRRLEEDMLRQSQLAAMGQVAAQLAHEIRNPLGAMELFVGLLIDELRTQPRNLHLAKQVAEGIADLNHLVTNVLDHCGRPTPRVRLVALEAIVEEALRHVSDLLEKHRIRVKIAASEQSTLIAADRNLLWQVFLNLARNAVEAMKEDGGEVRVEILTSECMATIKFIDNGPGIPREIAGNIFQPFFTTKERGTGLGLAVVKSIVNAHGGTVTMETGEQGTVFSVALPRKGAFWEQLQADAEGARDAG